MADRFVPFDRSTPHLLPPSIEDYVPEDHLARFVVDLVEQLDLSAITGRYGGRGGSEAWHPAMLVALLLYGYATGTFSSRKLERATYESVVYQFICAGQHPDHDSICAFRKRFLTELQALFVQVLVIAREMGVLKLGTVSLDGTKIKANASKHKALSWKYALELQAQLEREVEALMQLAEAADNTACPEDLNIPDEIRRRQERLAAIAQAQEQIQARAAERDAREQAAYEEKRARRKRKAEQTGRKPRGKPPQPPVAGPRDQDQVNLTDEESRIMPESGGGFEQSYNAQASVDIDSGLIVTRHVSQQANDQREVAPTLDQLQAQAPETGTPQGLLADAGYFSADNVKAVVDASMEPSISDHRERHHLPVMDRFADPPPVPSADPVAAMRGRMRTRQGRALYAKRKSTIEPAFGVIKQVQGFRQFLLRGVEAVNGEWNLVCMAFNLKKLHTLTA